MSEEFCLMCRKPRVEFVHKQVLPCCGHVVNICAERCAKILTAPLTVPVYVAKYVRMHRCPEPRKAAG